MVELNTNVNTESEYSAIYLPCSLHVQCYSTDSGFLPVSPVKISPKDAQHGTSGPGRHKTPVTESPEWKGKIVHKTPVTESPERKGKIVHKNTCN